MRSLGKRLPRTSQFRQNRGLRVKGILKSLSPGGPCMSGPNPQNKPTGSGHMTVGMRLLREYLRKSWHESVQVKVGGLSSLPVGL